MCYNLNNSLILFIPILVFCRTSPAEMVLGGAVLKTSRKFIENPYQGPCQNRTWYGCIPVNKLHIFRTLFRNYTSEGLLVILPIYGMNYPLIHGIKISFLLLHCFIPYYECGKHIILYITYYITCYYSIIYLLYYMLIMKVYIYRTKCLELLYYELL